MLLWIQAGFLALITNQRAEPYLDIFNVALWESCGSKNNGLILLPGDIIVYFV